MLSIGPAIGHGIADRDPHEGGLSVGVLIRPEEDECPAPGAFPNFDLRKDCLTRPFLGRVLLPIGLDDEEDRPPRDTLLHRANRLADGFEERSAAPRNK